MMTTATDVLRTAIAANAKELQQARADVALAERLRKAASEAGRLQRYGDELTAALSEALADEAKQAREATADKFRNVQIAVSYPRSDLTTLLDTVFTVRWEHDVFSSSLGYSVPMPTEAVGFANVPADLMDYLIQFRSDLLPRMIADLMPGDPAGAVERYLVAKRRGYLSH